MAAAALSSTVSRLFKSTSSSRPLSIISPKTLSFSPPTISRRLPGAVRFSTAPRISAAISVGDKLPDATLSYFDSSDELQTISISDLTSGKKAVIFAVPGAFTPTCSQKHLPGFVGKAGEIKAKGVDAVACVSVNDAFVMKAWKENLGIRDEVLMLSDGNGVFTRGIGVELDLSDKPVGLGVRSRRYAMLVEDGIVKVLNLEEGGAFNVSSAEDLLKAL
ncbi:unnamed protein product [Cuscuta campestris]|uniref:Glutaredoxin-dependent peroxiredoxin n=1 Tax=Cuscuta campestris TaxID=132261 RepID=A0A484LFE8_9ASTE|nr:unnamed protein product [Cuscuta campestris]